MRSARTRRYSPWSSTPGRGARTPVYGPLTSTGETDLLVGIPRDKDAGIVSDVLLVNRGSDAAKVESFCNDANNTEVGNETHELPAHSMLEFSSRAPSATCDLVPRPDVAAPGLNIWAGSSTAYQGSGDRVFTPAVLTSDFNGGSVLIPVVNEQTNLVIQNLWFETEVDLVFRDRNGKVKSRNSVIPPERALAAYSSLREEFGLPAGFRGSARVFSGHPLVSLATIHRRFDGQRQPDGDDFATTIPGYTTANATSSSAVALGFDYPEGATLVYRAVNPGKKTATIRVTIGRLDGTTVSSKRYKVKKYATTEITIPASEQGNQLYVRTEVLKKGPVVTHVEQVLSSGEVNYFPGLNES